MKTLQINHARLKSLHKIANDLSIPRSYSQKAARLYNKYCNMLKDMYASQPYCSPYRNVGNYECILTNKLR